METSEKEYTALNAAIATLASCQNLPATQDFRLMMKHIHNYQLQNTKTHLRNAKLHQSLIAHSAQLQELIGIRKKSYKSGQQTKQKCKDEIYIHNPENGFEIVLFRIVKFEVFKLLI
jgi:hypothetical protein